ncbi:MAG: DUF512 domain-containing protein [Clostridia bacterium]
MKKIISIENHSLAKELKIQAGDFLVSINGKEPQDQLDLMFLMQKNKLTIKVLQKNELKIFKIKKDDDEILGVNLENFHDMQPKCCKNNCIFCFVNQLPKNMRESLYVKDDDYRFSFLSGTYVTLTNISKSDLKRIKLQKLSPLFISVHATDSKIRNKMLGLKTKFNIMKHLKFLARAKIQMHCQVVLCKDINDGKMLEKTIKHLSKLFPFVKSLAVVPVGLTNCRNQNPILKPVDKACAENSIKIIKNYQQYMLKKHGERFVYGADELFQRAKIAIPSYQDYEDFSQLENGIGLIALQRHEFTFSLYQTKQAKNATFGIVTGKSAEKEMKHLCNLFEHKFPNVKIKVFGIENNFFGKSVTVAGLVTAMDIIKQLPKDFNCDNLVLPTCMLRDRKDCFLDDVKLVDLEKQLKVKIKKCESGEHLVKILASGNSK